MNNNSNVVEEEMVDSNNRRNMTSTSCRRRHHSGPPLLVTLVTLFSLLLVMNKEVSATTTTYGCMEAVSGLDLSSGCTAQDVKFERVSGFTVSDTLAQTCNCNCGGNTGKVCTEWNAETEGYAAIDCDDITPDDPISCWSPDGTLFGAGMVFGACLGADDNVQIALTVDLLVGSLRYDAAMYINIDGGSAISGDECAIVPMVAGTYGEVTVAETDGDGCPDFSSSGQLTNFPFDTITLACADNDGNGKLDFDVAVSWDQTSSVNCAMDGGESGTLSLPMPGTKSKCWKPGTGVRFEVDIYVPEFNTPSAQPSLSSEPSAEPSSEPSISSAPSESSSPSVSSQPSLSSAPSVSPSSQPSLQPSISSQPSSQPSLNPSISSQPSFSTQPSSQPSSTPSISTQPSSEPSSSPSVSLEPTSMPSLEPSISSAPSLSSRPSSATEEPSVQPTSEPSSQPSVQPTSVPSIQPSTSQVPSSSPSTVPSVSSMPSSEPTGKPTDQPSFSPTGSPYYPDWTADVQACVNDGNTPDYIKEVQRLNYLYTDKQECCETHFWWRVRNCMGNNGVVYYYDSPTGTCTQGTARDDYDIAYDDLQECCETEVYWDTRSCMAASPKEMQFEYTVDFMQVAEPENCQDADTMAKRVREGMAPGVPSGSSIEVVAIGGVTLSNDIAAGTTECGGSLAGQPYLGNWSQGTDHSEIPAETTVFKFRVTTVCSDTSCDSDSASQVLYDTTFNSLRSYASGSMNTDILIEAAENPTVGALQYVIVNSNSFAAAGSYTTNNPAEGESIVEATSLSVQGELLLDSTPTFVSSDDKNLAMAFYQSAIEATLDSQGLLTGSYVEVIDFTADGKVEYRVHINSATSADATTASSSIQTAIGQSLSNIETIVQQEAATNQAVTAAFGGDFGIASNTETSSSEVTVAQVTVQGEFITQDLGFAAIDEPFLEGAIYEVLLNKGAIPEGTEVEIIGYDGSGVIEYTITLYLDETSDLGAKTAELESDLTDTSTLALIASTAASAPGSTLTSFAILAGVVTDTTGVPTGEWYPDWTTGEDTCINDGNAPGYMSDIFMSSSKKECCDQWFSYDTKKCEGQTNDGGSTKTVYIPNWSDMTCQAKQEKDLAAWEETEAFDTLDDCCTKKLSFNYNQCCAGECQSSNDLVYYPKDGKCIGGSKKSLGPYEQLVAKDSAADCCENNYWWDKSGCCNASGVTC